MVSLKEENMNIKNRFYMVLVPIALCLTIAVNALANIVPLQGKTTGDISNAIPILFAPANYVFSIWSLIYAGLIFFAIYQLLPAYRENKKIEKIRPLFILGSIANSVWIFFWHYEYFWLSVLAMLSLYITLCISYFSILKEKKSDETSQDPRFFSLFVKAPHSLYVGWITVALIANIATALRFYNWNGFGLSDEIWTINLLVIACGIGALITLQKRDALFGAVLIWAFSGIAIKHSEIQTVSVAALIATSVITLSVIRVLFLKWYKLQRN